MVSKIRNLLFRGADFQVNQVKLQGRMYVYNVYKYHLGQLCIAKKIQSQKV